MLQSKVKVFLELYNQKKMIEEQARLLEMKVKELSELQEANFKLESLSTLDGLTGIPNRRSFDDYIEMSIKSCTRLNISLCHFKFRNYNKIIFNTVLKKRTY